MLRSAIYSCMRSIEAIENYALAINWPPRSPSRSPFIQNNSRNYDLRFDDDQDFWWHIKFEDRTDSVTFRFNSCVLSEWVARVPGLYWAEGAQALRARAKAAIELKSNELTVYTPLGKSQVVLGGIGTLKFPTDGMGNRLVTLSAGLNASSGVPALIAPEVWEYHQLEEGALLKGRAKWQPLSQTWAERFPSIKGIPRGYLEIKHPSQISVRAKEQPIQFHPCTVMEYYSEDAILYDFVYSTADTRVRNYRSRLELFFEEYKERNDRHGRYLLPADHRDALFDSEYRGDTLSGNQNQLHLMEERVRGQMYRNKTIDELLRLLASSFTNDDLQRMCREEIHVPPSIWLTDTSSAQSALRLIEACVRMNKVEELVDAMEKERPGFFQ